MNYTITRKHINNTNYSFPYTPIYIYIYNIIVYFIAHTLCRVSGRFHISDVLISKIHLFFIYGRIMLCIHQHPHSSDKHILFVCLYATYNIYYIHKKFYRV